MPPTAPHLWRQVSRTISTEPAQRRHEWLHVGCAERLTASRRVLSPRRSSTTPPSSDAEDDQRRDDGLCPRRDQPRDRVERGGTGFLLTGLGSTIYDAHRPGQHVHVPHRCAGLHGRDDQRSGKRPDEYSYEPFGAATVSGASSGNEFNYTGREDDATGLYYYRARYYYPQLGRFISEDPIGFKGGTSISTRTSATRHRS